MGVIIVGWGLRFDSCDRGLVIVVLVVGGFYYCMW